MSRSEYHSLPEEYPATRMSEDEIASCRACEEAKRRIKTASFSAAASSRIRTSPGRLRSSPAELEAFQQKISSPSAGVQRSSSARISSEVIERHFSPSGDTGAVVSRSGELSFYVDGAPVTSEEYETVFPQASASLSARSRLSSPSPSARSRLSSPSSRIPSPSARSRLSAPLSPRRSASPQVLAELDLARSRIASSSPRSSSSRLSSPSRSEVLAASAARRTSSSPRSLSPSRSEVLAASAGRRTSSSPRSLSPSRSEVLAASAARSSSRPLSPSRQVTPRSRSPSLSQGEWRVIDTVTDNDSGVTGYVTRRGDVDTKYFIGEEQVDAARFREFARAAIDSLY